MRRRSAVLALVRNAALACVVWTWAGAARAEAAPRATLVVTRGAGAEDCPNADGIAQRVAAITGTTTLQTTAQDRTDTWVHLELSRDLGRYTALVQLRGRHNGARALSDVNSDCSSLADAVAVALALFFDTQVAPVPQPPHMRGLVEPAPKPAPPRYAMELAGAVAFGLLSVPSPLATAGIDVTPDNERFRIGLGGGLVLPDRVRYLQGFTELRLAFGYARGCAEATSSASRVQLLFCVAPLLGALSGAGYDYDFIAKKRWLWAALTGGPRLQGPLSRPAFWSLSASAVVPLTLRAFAVTVNGEPHDVFNVPRLGASASAGMGVQF
jgi:hypothetical protein